MFLSPYEYAGGDDAPARAGRYPIGRWRLFHIGAASLDARIRGAENSQGIPFKGVRKLFECWNLRIDDLYYLLWKGGIT